MTPSLKASLQHYFKSYDSQVCYVTSDGMIFHKELDAKCHANDTLKDGQVAEFTRAYVQSLDSKTAKTETPAAGEHAAAGEAAGTGEAAKPKSDSKKKAAGK